MLNGGWFVMELSVQLLIVWLMAVKQGYGRVRDSPRPTWDSVHGSIRLGVMIGV